MGFFGFDSNRTDASQNYTDKRVAGTDYATVLAAQDKSNVVGPGSIQLSKGGTVVQTDASVTNIRTLDPKVATEAFNAYADLAETFAGAASEREGTLNKTFAGFFGPVLSQLSELSESKQTAGESQRDKTILIIVIGLLALVGFIFWRHR